MLRRLLFLLLLGACLVLAARVGQQHTWQVDLTAQRSHSLSPAASAALDALAGRLEITAFIADRPVQRAQIERLLAPYLDHPARPPLRLVDPVSAPQEARAAGAGGDGEIHLRSGAMREVVRSLDARALDLALHRLALRGERWVVALGGHGENAIDDGPLGLSTLAARLEPLGYRMLALDPSHLERLPGNTALLLLAGPEREYGSRARELIEEHLAQGGSLLWLLRSAQPIRIGGLTVETLPGLVVDAAAADQGLASPDHAIISEYPKTLPMQAPGGPAVLQQARALVLGDAADWRLAWRLGSSPRSWNESGSLSGEISRDPGLGEQAGPLDVVLALERGEGGSLQRAVFAGSAHFVGNAQLGLGDNLGLVLGLIQWLTSNEDIPVPAAGPDLAIRWSPTLAGLLGLLFMGLLPAAYIATGLILRSWRRRA